MGQLPKWTKEITEVSANVWKVTMTHELGSKVEMTGIDLDQLEKEAEVYLRSYMKHLVTTRNKYFGNAREVRKLVGEVIRNQNLRMADLPVKGRTPDVLKTILLDDVDDFVVKPIVKRPAMGFKSQKI